MRIAICGCGIGGLATAIFARRAGFDITLFDQFDAPEPVGSGLVIQPVGLRVLEQLGAADRAVAKGAKGFHMIGHEAMSGRKVLDVSYGPKGGANFGLGIHRASLFKALMDVAIDAGISITANHKVMSTNTDKNGRYVAFENGKTEGPFDLVVDTTGAGSPISALVSKPLPYGAIWGTVDWPSDSTLQYDCLQQRYRRASNMIGVLPIGTLPNDTTPKAALFWSLPRGEIDAWRNAPIEQWRRQATALWPELSPFTDQIIDHSQMTPAVYTHGSLRKPYGDRIVHIGDAAHRASPQLGQGANMALLDAMALVQCLTLFPVGKALRRYAYSRRHHTNAYQALSWTFTPMYQSNSRVLPILRDYILGPLSKVPPVPAILSSLVKGTMFNPIRGLPND
jgi:2-polyprenyl-6-methoxyphenol hydroxylase-like FAD-dependent oxidoreductase